MEEYMQFPQNKQPKPFYNRQKTNDSANLEQGPYENKGPSHTHNSYKGKNPQQYNKNKKYYNKEERNVHPMMNHPNMQNVPGFVMYPEPQVLQVPYGSWQHEKMMHDPQRYMNAGNRGPGKNDKKMKNKNSKRPDMQLYSAREKHVNNEDNQIDQMNPVTENGNNEVQREENNNQPSRKSFNQGNNVKIVVQTPQTGSAKSGEDKEAIPFEEDKSFLSNVSTAMSDKYKNIEEENGSREKVNSVDMSLTSKSPEHKLLFQIVINNDKGPEMIRFYEDEEDYESQLERIVINHGLAPKMGLYFKMNILDILRRFATSHRNRTRIETILEKYREINEKLVFYEIGMGELHEIIKPYLEILPNNLQNQHYYNSFINSPNPKYK